MAATHAQPSARPARRFIDRILGPALKERDLPAARGRPEAAAVELGRVTTRAMPHHPQRTAVERGRVTTRAMPVQPEAPAGDVEALLDEIGVVAGAGHAGTEVGIVVAP